MRLLLLALLALPLPLPAMELAPPVALRISHESLELTRDGVERRQRFSETFVREGDNVWLERVMPQAVRRTHRPESAPGHDKEIEVMAVPRWITRGAAGAAQLALVANDRRTLFEVPPSSFQALGFSGHWASSACLLDPATVRSMAVSTRAGAGPGASWRERQDGERYVRVLWDEALAYPRIIESGRLDGQQRARTVATVLPLPVQPPWQATRNYTRRDFSDLGD